MLGAIHFRNNLWKLTKRNLGDFSKTRANERFLTDKAFSPFVPKSAQELTQVLAENVLFHAVGDILVVDKPYGVGSLGYQQKGGGIFKQAPGRDSHYKMDERKGDGVTLEEALPYLKEIFNEPNLRFCTGLKRWVSGPVVLPCSEVAFNRIKYSLLQSNSIAHNTEERKAHYTYRALAICVSRPMEAKRGVMNTIYGYATFQKSELANEYIFVPSARINVRARRWKYAAEADIDYQVIASGSNLSLVDLHFSIFAKHMPRLVLSHLGAPIFGDWIYGRRLADVDGQPVCVDPKDAARGKLYEPKEFLRQLGLNCLQELKPNAPLFLHVYQSTLPFWGDKRRERKRMQMISRAPPPAHFLAMADFVGFTPAIEQLLSSLDADEEEFPITNSLNKRARSTSAIGGDEKY